jgi:hypothetical protein
VKVVYVIGYGRSGSTVLGVLLGNHPAIACGGELINMVQRAWLTPEYC